MLKSLEKLMNPVKGSEKWIDYLFFTEEKNYNLERLVNVKSLNNKLVYNYIIKNLEILDSLNLTGKNLFYVEETIKWSEVAKAGSKSKRREWRKKGFDLYVHNIGSSEIYKNENKDYDEVVRVLIKTHGLIGQFLRGEVKLNKNKELYELIEKKLINSSDLKTVLLALNHAVVGAVSTELYELIKEQINKYIDVIVEGKFEENEMSIKTRFSKLNHHITEEEYEKLNQLLKDGKIKKKLDLVFDNLELWYFEVSLNDFSLMEQIKLLLIASNYIDSDTEHLTFVDVMESMYIDYKENKQVNIYRKRIIEDYLNDIEIEEIIEDNIRENAHITHKVIKKQNTLVFCFEFSIQATKLIEFCEVAYSCNTLYQKAVFILYDLFGFRRDAYDRFYNEIDYLNTMNASMGHKAVILDYMVGSNILDVGPGGGALMDLIHDKDKDLNVYGIDIAANVIDSLNKRKLDEKRKWNVVKGDALNIDEHFKPGSLDTIIYSSIIHELFSYVEYNGKQFNHDVIAQTLKSAYNALSDGGRIIIRDGIMTEPVDQYRIIEFRDKKDIEILNRYCNDFQGREIKYNSLSDNKVKMLVNDAMEFLYTYTWGEDSYALEIKEQFGYFTPTEYVDLIKKNLDKAEVILCKPFLQAGYEENLLNKITIYDENEKIIKLPNSTCIIVIEKRR